MSAAHTGPCGMTRYARLSRAPPSRIPTRLWEQQLGLAIGFASHPLNPTRVQPAKPCCCEVGTRDCRRRKH